MVQWECKNLWIKGKGLRNLVDLDQLDVLMNSVGTEGWELVSVTRKGQNLAWGFATFKRERQPA